MASDHKIKYQTEINNITANNNLSQTDLQRTTSSTNFCIEFLL